MKAGDSATVISKHNYISYGLPSLDDLKRLRAPPFSRLVEREREREQWHFGQRPSGTIWRTSHALCYQKRGRSVSSIMLLMHCLHSGSYIHVVILTLNAGTDAGSVGFYKPEKICSASKSEFKMIRKHAERKFHSNLNCFVGSSPSNFLCALLKTNLMWPTASCEMLNMYRPLTIMHIHYLRVQMWLKTCKCSAS